MSTYWGYVCLNHEPPLHSEPWLNHGEETLERYLRAFRAGGYTPDHWWGERPRLTIHRGFDCPPDEWLLAHPDCRVALGNEYGEIVELDK